MRTTSILSFVFILLFLTNCNKEMPGINLENERVREVVVKVNATAVLTYDFRYNGDGELSYYILNNTDTFQVLTVNDRFLSQNLDGSYTYLPLFRQSGGRAISKEIRYAYLDEFYYKKDSGILQYNEGGYMTYYDNVTWPDRAEFNYYSNAQSELSYTNRDYTRLSGILNGGFRGSAEYTFYGTDLNFSYVDSPSSLGFINFGIGMFGKSNGHATDSICGTVHTRSGGAITSDFTDTIRYKVRNEFDTKGRIIKTNFLPYNFTIGNVFNGYNHVFYFAGVDGFSMSDNFRTGNGLEYQISYY